MRLAGGVANGSSDFFQCFLSLIIYIQNFLFSEAEAQSAEGKRWIDGTFPFSAMSYQQL